MRLILCLIDPEMFPARFSWRLHMEKAIKKSERFVDSLNKEQKFEIKNFFYLLLI